MSPSQRRLWLLNQIDRESVSYNEAFRFEIGNITYEELQESTEILIKRHEPFRTSFQLKKMNQDKSSIQLLRWKLKFSTPSNGKHEEFINEFVRQPFDLQRPPLIRVALVMPVDENPYALFVFHHIVCDAWSNDLFFRELALLIAAKRKKESCVLSQLQYQFADYCLSLEKKKQMIKEWQDLHYWKDMLNDYIELPLPTKPRSPDALSEKC